MFAFFVTEINRGSFPETQQMKKGAGFNAAEV